MHPLLLAGVYGYFLLYLACQFAQAQPTSQPNVIIIYADDLGYGDLSSFGGDISTPNIDRIGNEGIRFTDFYVAAPVCTPSRYSLLTGSYPQRSRHGLEAVIMPGDDHHFDEQEVTLAELLKAQGYRTALVGKWHLGSKQPSYLPMHHGFDMFTGHTAGCMDYFYHVYGGLGNCWMNNGKPAREEGYATDLITNHALNFIQTTQDQASPFFLFLSYNAPHFGKTDPDRIPAVTVSLHEGIYQDAKIMNSLQAPEAYVERFAHIEDPYRRLYTAMVANLDDNVGRVLATLDQDGLLDNTLIWFISDNGGYAESYYGHASNGALSGEKASLWEGGIRVPALLCWKGTVKPGQVISQPLCNVDVLPTLANLIGFSEQLATLPIDGVDASRVLLDQKTIERDIYWQYQDQTAFRRGDWKLRNFTELYHLPSDVGEKRNVAAQHPEKLKELQQTFERMSKSLNGEHK